MKNHELLDLLGEVNEDYVQAADGKVIRPRFGWKKLAVCAACAALVLGAYPVYRMSQPQAPSGLLPLHDYTIVEGGGMTTLDDMKIPATGQNDLPGQVTPAPNPDEDGILNPDDPIRGEGPQPGGAYIGDAPLDEATADQYDRLLQGMGMHGEGAASYPDWFAGAWIDTSCYYDSPAVLTVAIVDGFRTPEREAEITGWCGSGVVFQDAKYSYPHLNSLMEQTVALLDGTGLSCGIGVYVMDNCLGVDIYSDGKDIPKEVLVKLGQLDPDGDAIRVRLFTGKLDTLTDQEIKGPAPAPVDPEVRDTPALTDDGKDTTAFVENGAPVPGGVTQPQDGTRKCGETEVGQPAQYGLLPADE